MMLSEGSTLVSTDLEREINDDRKLFELLTPQQRKVLLGIADGLSSKEIAHRLGITDKTVEFHRGKIFRTLGCANAVSAVRFAIRVEFIQA